MNLDEAKIVLKRKILSFFPNCLHVDFSFDPEDEGIIYVGIYGIPDDETYAAHCKACGLIDDLGSFDDAEFVPSIISMTNTRLYHSELLPPAFDFDRALPDVDLRLLGSFDSREDIPFFLSTPLPADRLDGLHVSAVLDVIDEQPHERNDIKLAA